MMKIVDRFFSFFCTMIISLSVFNNTFLVYAEDNTDFNIVYIDLIRDEKKMRSPAIQKGDVLYLSSELLSDVSDFHYLPDRDKFIHDNAENNKGFREIWTVDSMLIIVSWLSAMPVYQKTVTTSQPIEYNNDKYFSLSDIFPLLNVDAEIKDGALIISDIQHSLTDIFSKYDLGTTLYQTYDDSDILGLSNEKILYGYSYFFTGLTDFAWKRLIFLPSGNWGKLEEYKEIFSSYLIDTETGLEEVIQGDNRELYSSLIDYHNSQDADKGETLSQSLDALGSYGEYEMKELLKKYPTMGGLDTDANRMILASKFSDMNQFNLRLLSCFAILNNYVKDHYEMLNSVYSLSGKNPYSVATKSVDKNAAKHIYNQYVENNVSQTLTYFFADELTDFAYKKITDAAKEKLLEETTGEALDKALMEIKLGSIISKLAFEGLAEVGLEVKSYEVAKRSKYLEHFNVLMETSSSQYYRYCNSGNISESNMNNIRLSAIMALLSSRSLYQAMADAQGVYNIKASYEHKRIDLINEALKKLYLANNSSYTDTGEYIDNSISKLKSGMKTLNLYDNQFTDQLNISATVFAKDYQIPDAGPYLALYEAPSTDSKQITSIPKGSKVNIISIPDNYQDGDWNHKMALVNYNGQEGYVHTNYLLCDPEINMSSYSNDQLLDVGKILFEEYDTLSYVFALGCGFTDTEFTNDYYENYEKILPKGLTIQGLKNDFYNYFSKDVTQFFRCCTFEDLYIEKDGYLWRATGWGDEVYLDHFEVKAVKNVSDTEIAFEVDELLIPDFYDIYHTEKYTYDFKIVKENEKWMLTIPEEKTVDTSSQSNLSYEDIYGSLVFDGVNNTKGLYGHEDYIRQPTAYQIQKYFLNDINNDGIKELILEVTVAGTDETFRECYTYENGSAKWLGTYDDIYVAEDCYVASDGNGLVVVSLADDEMEMFKGYAYRYWRPWEVKEKDHMIPYVSEFPKIGYYLTDYDNPSDIPENIRSKLGKKLVAYAPSDRSPLLESINVGNRPEQNSSETSISDAYAIMGTVKTKGGDLNLRSSPFADDNENTITKMPNNSSLKILLPVFENHSESNKDWYLVEYNNKIGYASAKYIQKTDNHVAFTENELKAIAKRLYYEAYAADVRNFSTCFDIDYSHTVPIEENHSGQMIDCYILPGIKERTDFFNAIHKSFSEKYDSERVFDRQNNRFMGIGGLMNEYGELDSRHYVYCFDDTTKHQFYLCSFNFNRGDLLLSSISAPPFSAIQINSSNYSGSEIFFNGILDFTQDAVIRETMGNAGYDRLPVNDFSICFEEGRWKIGKFTPIQY